VLLVPNAALRFKPTDTAASTGGFASAMMPHRAHGTSNQQGQAVAHGKGASQTVYVLDASTNGGAPNPVEIQTGVTDGTMTEVVGGALAPGMQVITGQLASGGS